MKFLFAALFIFPSIIWTQMIDNQNLHRFPTEPMFDQEFVKWKKIKSLKGTYTFIRLGKLVNNTDYAQYYEFDTLGRLTVQYETRQDDGTRDTSWRLNSYLKSNEIDIQLNCANNLCLVKALKRDSAINATEINTTLNYTLLDSTIALSSEKVIHERLDRQQRDLYYNDNGLPFQMVEEYFSEFGKRQYRITRSLITSDVIFENFKYNADGYLQQFTMSNNQDSIPSRVIDYEYDEFRILKVVKEFKNQKNIFETEFFYSDDGLLQSLIIQDFVNDLITIIRFNVYSYY
jgi:hypothetical protein